MPRKKRPGAGLVLLSAWVTPKMRQRARQAAILEGVSFSEYVAKWLDAAAKATLDKFGER